MDATDAALMSFSLAVCEAIGPAARPVRVAARRAADGAWTRLLVAVETGAGCEDEFVVSREFEREAEDGRPAPGPLAPDALACARHGDAAGGAASDSNETSSARVRAALAAARWKRSDVLARTAAWAACAPARECAACDALEDARAASAAARNRSGDLLSYFFSG